jgi:hypothetical protein
MRNALHRRLAGAEQLRQYPFLLEKREFCRRDGNIFAGRLGETNGLPVIMGADRAAHSTFMQVAGTGQRISAQALRQAMKKSGEL